MSGSWKKAALAAGLALCVGAGAAQAASPELVAAAEKEGALNLYASTQQYVMRPWIEAFNKKYPKIKVDHTFSAAGDLLTRIFNEAKAGKLGGDITTGGSSMSALFHQNLLESYTPDSAAGLPPEYKDKDGYWMATDLYFLGSGYNTDLVKPADAPKTYDDLLNPKWKGKMAWTNQMLQGGPLGFIANVLSFMGEDKGMEYLKKLATQQIVNYPATQTGVLDQLAAGAYPVAIMMFNTQTQLIVDKGGPVHFINMEPVFGIVDTVSILKGAPHPNAAKLWDDFSISEEGQQVMKQVGYIPTNPKVAPPVASLRPDTGHFKANFLTPDQLDQGTKHWKDVYDQLFR